MFDKLRLYIESTQVALVNQALGQADALLKAAIVLFTEVPPKIEVVQAGGRGLMRAERWHATVH